MNKYAKKVNEFKESFQGQLAALELEAEIAGIVESLDLGININETLIVLHKGFSSVCFWRDSRTKKTFADVSPIIEKLAGQIVPGEHWNDGSISTWPREINPNAQNPNAKMDGSFEISIKCEAGRGYGPYVIISFFVRINNKLLEFNFPVNDGHRLLPSVRGKYDEMGYFLGFVEWPYIKNSADKFIKYWSNPPQYHGNYFFSDSASALNWIAKLKQQK